MRSQPTDRDQPGGSRTTTRRSRDVLAALSALVTVGLVTLVVGCNMHEIGHAVVASILGWEVERVELCLPSWGGVVFAAVPETRDWTWFAVGISGGVFAAAFLALIYLFVVESSGRPSRGPAWWGGGLATVLWVGPQLVIGVLEGIAELRGDDYTEYFSRHPALVVPLLVVAMLAGATAYGWRWRSSWRRKGGDDGVGAA